MARVFEQLNFYDIFGYLMPGAVVVGCALLLVDATFPDATFDLSAASGAELTGLLFLAYLVGHIVQAVGRRIEPPLNAIMWDGWPSEALLRPDDKRFTVEFKTALRRLVADRYTLAETASAADIFAVCYSYVIQNGIRRRVEAFLGLSGLSRGMIVASIAAALLLGTGAGARVYHGDPTKDIALYAGGAATAAVAALAFVDRLVDFSQRFAEAVYRDFYVAHEGHKQERVEDRSA
jgi:hypothetical protein